MPYRVSLTSLAERQEIISREVEASNQTREFYAFRSTKKDLPLIRVSEPILIYRMENFRTFVDQREFEIRERKERGFFLTGQENQSVQQVQHEILARIASKGRADSVVAIIDVLKKEKQREPLIITSRGVVVNGNRRLAAMRELYVEDAGTYGEFSHIDCLVLPPDATADEILDVEAELQAKPETRLDYDWIGDCELLQNLIDRGKTIPQIARKYNRKVPEIKNALSALTEANLYLKDWVKAEGEYNRVVDAEQFFKDLPKQLSGKTQEMQDAGRIIAWNLFDNKEKLEDRLYAFNSVYGKHAALVMHRMIDELDLSAPAIDDDDDEGFDVDIGGGGSPFQTLIDTLQNPDKKEEATEVLIDVCQGVLESERGKKSGRAALKSISQANTKLTETDLTKADTNTYDAIGTQLDQIESRVRILKAALVGLQQKLADTESAKEE